MSYTKRDTDTDKDTYTYTYTDTHMHTHTHLGRDQLGSTHDDAPGLRSLRLECHVKLVLLLACG